MPTLPEPYLSAHQTRQHEPSPYENLLGDGIEAAFRAGITELPELVAYLNDTSVPAPGGGGWTDALFTSEMRRLGG